ncbi:RNA pseudouridine synthase [Pseudidiomarina aestuarii]|uniref:Pseudouridine synthase n=1 Tax=Pseudidiomarina aestuarii TaxID=624146 RepID=A0A2T4D2K7_9GAMM|nr:RNA pseudouridine synthase [Pseudidiomarina aestuarii]
MTLVAYSPPQTPYLEILYQDDAIVVVNKPSGLLSVPGKAKEHYDSLWSRLHYVLPTIRIVHRLDMATSGLLVFALTKPSQAHLQRQFERRSVKKAYRARVWGDLPAESGSVTIPLRCDWPNRPRQMVDPVLGKPATTNYRILASTKTLSKPYSDVELEPYTGRSHQLRVHMQWLGHPILGDKFYAHDEAYHASDRLLLHAESLAFYHPIRNDWLAFNAPVPF